MDKKSLSGKVWTPSPEELARQRKWCISEIKRIGEKRLAEMIGVAVEARKRAYSPYFNYPVGASILCKSGKIDEGCNAETVTATETEHAERAAVNKAIGRGEVKTSGRKFIEVVVVSHSGESAPCGGCRQKIAQHCDNALVVDVDGEGNIQKIASLKVLFPYAFTPSHLEE